MASSLGPHTRKELYDLLKAAGCHSSKKSSRKELVQTCINQGLRELLPHSLDADGLPVTKDVEVKAIVKSSLEKAMRLDAAQLLKFQSSVDVFVDVISKSLRRASLVLNHYLARQAALNAAIPDLYQKKDTYWKNWLKIGIDNVFPEGQGVREAYEAVAHLVGNVYSAGSKPPAYLDQVLNYAGHTLKTAVSNNAWVPLFVRLRRVLKEAMHHQMGIKRGSISIYTVMNVLRKPFPEQDPSFTTWPAVLQEYLLDVRTRLRASPDAYLPDDYGKQVTFSTMYSFNHWMQTQLEAMNKRRIRLSPIFQTRRAHVRLDTKTLLFMLKNLFPDDPVFVPLVEGEKRHRADKKAGGHGHDDPDEYMLPRRDSSSMEGQKKKTKKQCSSDEEWQAVKDAERQYQEALALVRASEEYKTQKKKHDAYVQLQTTIVASFFAGVVSRRTARKKKWSFDASIMTDGVSASLQFSTMDRVPVASKKKAQDKKARKQQRGEEPEPVEDYDRNLSTHVTADDGTMTLILGVDPGRSNIATVAFVYYERDEFGRLVRQQRTWKLTRGQYYQESGIRRATKDKAKRFEDLNDALTALGADDASLGSTRPEDHLAYLERYATIRDSWWSKALQRVESVAALKLYAGKRRVLDGFFAKIKGFAKKAFPYMTPHVAYGSAVQTMKATGRCESAVPTNGTFQACKRVFGKDLSVTDEAYSTKVSWESGLEKERVYKVLSRDPADPTGRRLLEKLQHMPASSRPPVASAEDVDAVKEYLAHRRHKESMRRGGCSGSARLSGRQSTPWRSKQENEKQDEETRYPEVRGLRFCPEDRKFRDRDVQAALTIARLCCMTSTGQGRPLPFCRSQKRYVAKNS